MPNRVVREGILRSRRIDALSDHAEIFYRRLMSVVDDYGRYEADPVLLRADLYPLRINRVTDQEIEAWLAECTIGSEPLIALYVVNGVRYLEIQNFNQRLRNMKGECPAPDGQVPERRRPIDGQLTDMRPSRDGRTTAMNRNESETNTKAKGEGANAPKDSPPAQLTPPPVEDGVVEDPQCIANAIVRELMERHPERSDFGTALTACFREMKRYPDRLPSQLAESFRARHSEHLKFWERKRVLEPRARIPALQYWFSDGVYLQGNLGGKSPARDERLVVGINPATFAR